MKLPHAELQQLGIPTHTCEPLMAQEISIPEPGLQVGEEWNQELPSWQTQNLTSVILQSG